jgi:hypothetical protein
MGRGRPKKDTIPDIVMASRIFNFVKEGEAQGRSRADLFAEIRNHFKISDRTIKRRLAVIQKARARMKTKDNLSE